MTARLSISARVLPDGKPQTIVGRNAWALQELLRFGDVGITSLQNPAPRLAHYIFCLRTRHGLAIETIEEPHGGPYRGSHARYKLKSEVEILPAVPDTKAAA